MLLKVSTWQAITTCFYVNGNGPSLLFFLHAKTQPVSKHSSAVLHDLLRFFNCLRKFPCRPCNVSPTCTYQTKPTWNRDYSHFSSTSDDDIFFAEKYIDTNHQRNCDWPVLRWWPLLKSRHQKKWWWRSVWKRESMRSMPSNDKIKSMIFLLRHR